MKPPKIIALAGNPNVGKSTVFNSLTGLHQHTGNWPGKTVACAEGTCIYNGNTYTLVDLPGTYSLLAHSAEEEVARDYICGGGTGADGRGVNGYGGDTVVDAVIVVCDATCLERNLNLVLQTLELTPRVVVCANFMDEAKAKRIEPDLPLLARRLGVPVVGTAARARAPLHALLRAADAVCGRDRGNECGNNDDGVNSEGSPGISRKAEEQAPPVPYAPPVVYPSAIEDAVAALAPLLAKEYPVLPARWLALRLLCGDPVPCDILPDIEDAVAAARPLPPERTRDAVATALVRRAQELCDGVCGAKERDIRDRDRRIDRVLTGRRTGVPLMLLLLFAVFWITLQGANIPSQWLSTGLFWIQDRLTDFFTYIHAPVWLHGLLVLGVYRVLAWVVSVMLPPMAIFFPLFTLLEDAGYLPRVAFNLDRPFQKCRACGKQALTMCMGFGCNAAGVIGCRIIDSPRERLIAILTNTFVPCNGRFPTLIVMLGIFFVLGAGAVGFAGSLLSAALLTLVIVCGVLVTFAVSWGLSRTLLKGVPSSFTLELPPYRRPQIGKVLVRSVLDRTLFVLARAVMVAAPAGLVIWVMANVTAGGTSLLTHTAQFLDPFARLMGLDGVILLAFILGFPANEIVVPIILMAYASTGSIFAINSLTALKDLLIAHGWTWCTAVCVMLFSLMHWPCSTTVLTIHKETGSLKWTAAACVIPTLLGVMCCMAFTAVMRLVGAL